ncbi:LysR family transcriptional regulator [Paenibacillus sp. P25]|nr:LysR family transcriptional regulator [Paenibacillus sp. P25]
MNLHALKLFHTADPPGQRYAGLREELRISQPAVTAQIRNLEKELGLPFWSLRDAASASPVPGSCSRIMPGGCFPWSRGWSRPWTITATVGPDGARLAATYLPANRLLPGWMAEFKRNHPAIELALTTVSSAQAAEPLLGYKADIAFIGGGAPLPPDIEQEALFDDPILFIVPKEHPFAGGRIRLEHLLELPFVLREEGSSAREMLFALCRSQRLPLPQVGLEFSGMNETIRAVVAGYGASVLSALEAEEYLKRGDVASVEVEGVRTAHPIRLCTLSGDPLSPAAAPFLAFVREQMKIRNT